MRRILAVLAIVAGTLGTLPASPASARGAFTFYGSGSGHGLGMSQWGLRARAGRGATSGPHPFYAGTRQQECLAAQ